MDEQQQLAVEEQQASQQAFQVQPPEVAQQGVVVDFGERPAPTPCSFNECINGHRFPPLIQIGKCPGCGSPIIAVKMVNCPICNEPVGRLSVRQEHVPQGGQILPLCAGSPTLNDVMQLDIHRNHHIAEQTTHKEREMISKV